MYPIEKLKSLTDHALLKISYVYFVPKKARREIGRAITAHIIRDFSKFEFSANW